jgi:ribosomal protein S8
MIKNNYFFGISEINKFYKIYLKYNSFGNSIISNIIAIPKKQFKYHYLSLFELKTIKGLTYILSVPTKGIITHNDAIFFNKAGQLIIKISP